MCGIAGVLDDGGRSRADQLASRAARMAALLAHRGPDDDGVWSDDGVALGFRRLAIIDLSPHGRQPMVSPSGRHVIVFNGELYNFRALRRELERAGVRFRGGSDTEVLLGAIDEWGLETALERANGMFAFALWDRTRRELRLARDRIGEKPLYYAWDAGRFVFASEMRALRAGLDTDPGIDRDAVAGYLRLGYLPEPASIRTGVRKLPPATIGTVDTRRRHVDVEQYWSAEAAAARGRARQFPGTADEAVDELDALLRDAVRLRLESDVPRGAFLSGGIDSSTVAALMQAESSAPVATFTIGAPDPEYDESAAARRVAHHLGTEHHELTADSADALAVVPELSSVYDEPFGDPSALPTVLLCRLARAQVTVGLSGDGGDELFGGYNRYVLGRAVWKNVGGAPLAVRRVVARVLGEVPTSLWERSLAAVTALVPRRSRPRAPGYKLQRLGEIVDAPRVEDLELALISQWTAPETLVIGTAGADGADLPNGGFPNATDRMMLRDLVSYLPGDTLVKLDRASMSTGLEARVPLLDHRVVEWAWRLPLDLKIRAGRGKWILRRVLDRYVPRALVDRPKTGFDPPLDSWLRGPLRPWAEDLLSERRLRAQDLLRPEPIRRAWDEHLTGRRNHVYRLWPVLMLEAWLDAGS